MQTILINLGEPALDIAWLRAAIRECITYGEHGVYVEEDEHGHAVCFNCRGRL